MEMKSWVLVFAFAYVLTIAGITIKQLKDAITAIAAASVFFIGTPSLYSVYIKRKSNVDYVPLNTSHFTHLT